jgi:hypothetical protein
METTKEKNGSRDLKEMRDSPPRRSLREIPLSGPAANSEPAAEILAKGREEPMLINMPEVKPKKKKLCSKTVVLTYNCSELVLLANLQ